MIRARARHFQPWATKLKSSSKRFCRLAVTGNPHGPSLYHLLEVLGKEKSLARIERALTKMG
jgi:glutamyl/glutaminyl-tRNA synthetase